MKSRLGKRSFDKMAKSSRSNGSGALLDDFDRFDIKDRDDDFNDDQYNELLADSKNYRKTIASHDFEEDPKYKGVKVSKKDFYNNDNDDDDEEILSEEAGYDEESEMEEEQTQKKSKKASPNDFNVDKLLKEIDNEDREIISTKKDQKKELKKAKAVKNQQAIFDMEIESRVKMQDLLKLANRLPYAQIYPLIHKVDTSKDIKKNLRELEIEIVDLIDMLTNISSDYHEKVQSNCSITSKSIVQESQNYLLDNHITSKNFLNTLEFDTEQIWKSLDSAFETQSVFVDDVISNWAQKFNIMNQSSFKGKFSNIFQTPTEQTNKVMEDYDRLIKRSQLKDLSAKPLFDKEASTNYEEEIYNDEEFYLTLFREMLQKQAQVEAQNTESGEFLVENTRLYLKNRQLKSKPKKDVDRKASKNRKLRFDVHSKIMNFMAPVDNLLLLPGRDQLLKNLFGLYDKIAEKVPGKDKASGSGLKKRKKNPDAEFEISLL